jgi:molybdate transport system substrate-binding protein
VSWFAFRLASCAIVLAGFVAFCGCGPSPAAQGSGSGPLPPRVSPEVPIDQASGTVTVFAASSLTDAFGELAQAFQAANPGARVELNFGGSTQLFTQIDQGAPADVFASADQVQMDRAKAAGRIDGPDRAFATNRLVVIAPASNPAGLTGPGDLARPGVRLVTSQADVPIGAYTQTMLDRMSQVPTYGAGFKDRVNANVVSREANVRQIVAKVQLGEADAAVVYRTDATPQIASQLAIFDVPDQFNVPATYPIAVVQGAPNRAAASSFVEFVLSPTGQAILARWSFSTTTGR